MNIFSNNFLIAIIAGVMVITTLPAESSTSFWTHPVEKPTSYLFAPGIFADEHQVAKYCRSYTCAQGKTVLCDNNFEVINASYCTSCNFAEIATPLSYSLKHIPSYLTTQGYFFKRLMVDNKMEKLIFQGAADSGSQRIPINLRALNLGQTNDLALLSATYDNHITMFPDHEVVLYGFSRGAAAAVNFIAHEYDKKELKNIRLIILEGCFDNFQHLLECYYPKLSKTRFFKTGFNLFVKFFIPSYNPNGMQPSISSESFVQICNQYEIPVLIVYSQRDSVVPAACSKNLINLLQNAGLQNLHTLELQKSPHPRYMMHNQEDSALYQQTVHRLYKKYNLSHNPFLAGQG